VTKESAGQIALAWNASSGATAYNVYRSPLSGGGYTRANSSPVTGTNFTVTGLANGTTYYFIVKALDADGNESDASSEVSGIPHLVIGWANLQWPPTIAHTISAVNRTPNIYGQIWIDGVTNQPGAAPGVRAQVGFGPGSSDPTGNAAWNWTDATFNTDAGNNDEYVGSLLPSNIGNFDYAYRYTTTNGRDWVYADLDGIGNGYSPAQAGKMRVSASSDVTAPPTPTFLHVVSSTVSNISLAWDAVTGDATLY